MCLYTVLIHQMALNNLNSAQNQQVAVSNYLTSLSVHCDVIATEKNPTSGLCLFSTFLNDLKVA